MILRRKATQFDKNFGELMRLQGVAAEHVRFKDGYKGYILINVSEFIKHEREPYFIRSLKFLHDENENWRYIFMVDKENEKAAREMTQVILEIIKFTKVIDNEVASDNNRKFLKKICDEANLKFESDAFEFIESLLTNEKLSRNVVETIVCDLSAVCEHSAVSLREIKEYFDNESTVIRYMLTQNHYERILMLCNDLMKKGREDD